MNWAGVFMNYMDYTPDQFTTMFTKGQVEVINETLEVTVQYRGSDNICGPK